MIKATELIINESYWSFFKKGIKRSQEFITPSLQDLNPEKDKVSLLTRNLALIMKNYDDDKTSQYGIEIKTNGSSRSSRIPLARYSIHSQSIWRVVKDLKSFEKGIIELKDLSYYLSNTRTDNKLPMPFKVLVITFPEAEYINNEFGKFITDKASESKIIVITLEFIKILINSSKKININNLFSSESIVLTTKPIEL